MREAQMLKRSFAKPVRGMPAVTRRIKLNVQKPFADADVAAMASGARNISAMMCPRPGGKLRISREAITICKPSGAVAQTSSSSPNAR